MRPLLALLITAGLLGLTPRAKAAPALDDAARARLDRIASRQVPETPAQKKVDLAGSVPAFLLDRTAPPECEERDRSRAFHAALNKRERLSAPPAAARCTFEKLVKQLPAHLKPASFRYALHVIDRKDHVAFTAGGGDVYVSKPLLDALTADPKRGEAALAFVLARELGHTGLGHTRRGWQRVILEEGLKKGVADRTRPGPWRGTLDTAVAASSSLVKFLYTREQHAEADLFALQLCRLAGHDDGRALDGLRVLAALRHPGALKRDDYNPAASKLPPTLAYYLSESADPLARLRRLLMEKDGDTDDEKTFGLFLYDRKTGGFTKAADASVAEEDRPIVFVHGLLGSTESFRAYLEYFGERKELLGRKLLVFRYPGNGSLAHAGAFLDNETRRVMRAPSSATFVCHSAGGLVFRYYAEKKAGGFAHAVLLGTPHAGSDLTELKYLVDVGDLAGDAWSVGIGQAIASSLPEGRGQITHDLHPDSLFLRALGRDARKAKRYHVVVGEYLTTAQALALRASFGAGKHLAQKKGLAHLREGVTRDHAERALAGLRLPEEVTKGDLIVATRSAKLPGARATKVAVRHQALRTDPEVIRLVLASVTAG